MAQAEIKMLTAHVPLDITEEIDRLANRLNRPSAWVDQEEERKRLTREALADVDAGRVVDHAAVLAWAESLGSDTPLPLPTPRSAAA